MKHNVYLLKEYSDSKIFQICYVKDCWLMMESDDYSTFNIGVKLGNILGCTNIETLEYEFDGYDVTIDKDKNHMSNEEIINIIQDILDKIPFDFKLIKDAYGDVYIPLNELKEEYRIKDIVKVNLNHKNVIINGNNNSNLKNDRWTILSYIDTHDDLGVEVKYIDEPITAFIPWDAMIEVIEEIGE